MNKQDTKIRFTSSNTNLYWNAAKYFHSGIVHILISPEYTNISVLLSSLIYENSFIMQTCDDLFNSTAGSAVRVLIRLRSCHLQLRLDVSCSCVFLTILLWHNSNNQLLIKLLKIKHMKIPLLHLCFIVIYLNNSVYCKKSIILKEIGKH